MKELDEYYDTYMEFGYEGQIVRVNACTKTNEANCFLNAKTFQMPNILLLTSMRVMVIVLKILQRILYAKMKQHKIFNSNIKGTHEYLAEILENKENYIGKQATIKFFELTLMVFLVFLMLSHFVITNNP